MLKRHYPRGLLADMRDTPPNAFKFDHKISIYTPLPQALAHYALELEDVLAPIGSCRRLEAEAENQSSMGKARVLLGHLRIARQLRSRSTLTVVTWPLLGWLDLLVWRRNKSGVKRPPTALVMHDPVPLRRQFGMGRLAKCLIRAIPPSRLPLIVVHSDTAQGVVRSTVPRARIVRLPHPMLPPRMSLTPRAGPPVVLVLGQYKPSRDLSTLHQLGELMAADNVRLRIAGRAWPNVSGWERLDTFLTEDAFNTELEQASVLILPYRYYFQSGVAVRALENSIPVVGRRHDFLESLLGADYPGLVDSSSPGEWREAILSATNRDVRRESERARLAYQQVAKRWCDFLRVCGEDGNQTRSK